jgi:serine/threonine-protein kinase PpkA
MTSDVKTKTNALASRHFPSIEGYRFLQTIARSPHSEVHVAYSDELKHNVAVKVLRLEKKNETDARETERFERERLLLTRVKHPAVVDIYDWGETPQFHYIVTEYFPAGSLELRIRNLMKLRDAVDIFVQIAGALVAVHSAGLCHRDLKPGNVMLRSDGRVVLIDFGLAKLIDGAHAVTVAGEIRGSPYYVSPEQADGLPVDQRSDLYSLGVIFYEMLTGERPFKGNSVISILNAHKHDAIPRLRDDLNGLQPLIDQLLAKDPNARVHSAGDALMMLSKLPL